jgi:hypothetical protein
MASLKATLPDPLVSDRLAPSQVVAGAGVVATARPPGMVKVIPDCVSANRLLLESVTVSTALLFTGTLVGEKVSATVGDATVTVMGVTHALALVPADDGAVVTAPFVLKVITAVSVLPAESVTINVKVPLPLEFTATEELAAPEAICTAPLAVHA